MRFIVPLILVLTVSLLGNQNILKRYHYIAKTGNAMVKPGDIDGDGKTDFLILTGETTVHCRVLSHSGATVADIDMKESEVLLRIPATLWDINEDGKEELVGIRYNTKKGQYYLYAYDPTAKKVLAKVPVPSTSYSKTPTLRYKTIGIAYFDEHPYVVYGSGHQKDQHRYVVAYRYENQAWNTVFFFHEPPGIGLSSAHRFEIADINQDGKDEAFLGVYRFGKSGFQGLHGKQQWNHADGVYISDIRPDVAGLEVFMHFEQPPWGGYLTDNLGNVLTHFCNCKTTFHAHAGFAADISEKHPGKEMFVYYKLPGRGMKCPHLHNSKGGQLIKEIKLDGVVDWDGVGVDEIIYRSTICQYNSGNPKPIKPIVRLDSPKPYIQDIYGDAREEIITFSQYLGFLTMTIYSNSEPLQKSAEIQNRGRNYLQNKRWAGH